VIAQVMLQGSLNSLLEENSCGAASRLDAGRGTDELVAGNLAGIIELDQPREAPLETAGQGIGKREKLFNHRIAAGV
jgi:hypothetical protein